MAVVITINDLTNGSTVNQTWTGTGVFDVLIDAVNSNIEIQYQKGRITGSDYATVYLGAMQAVLDQSVKFMLGKTDVDFKERDMAEKELSGIKQREVMQAQRELYDRQKLSFDDNKYQKLLEAQLNYNSMVFQDASSPSVLGISLENRVNDVYNKIVAGLPLTPAAE